MLNGKKSKFGKNATNEEYFYKERLCYSGFVEKIQLHLGSISPTYLRGFFARTRWEAFNGKLHLANGAQIWRIFSRF